MVQGKNNFNTQLTRSYCSYGFPINGFEAYKN